MNKQAYLDAAEVFDSWRIVPRLIMFLYLGLMFWVTVYFSTRYFGLPAAERSATLTAFSSVVLTAAYGALPFIYRCYSDTSRDWDAAKRPPVVVQQGNNAGV